MSETKQKKDTTPAKVEAPGTEPEPALSQGEPKTAAPEESEPVHDTTATDDAAPGPLDSELTPPGGEVQEAKLPEDFAVERLEKTVRECENEISRVSLALNTLDFGLTDPATTLEEAVASFERYTTEKAQFENRLRALHAVRPFYNHQLEKARTEAKLAVRVKVVKPIAKSVLSETDQFKRAQILRQLAQIGGMK